MQVDTILTELVNLRALPDEESAARFESAVEKLVGASLSDHHWDSLFGVLSDLARYQEAMWSLIRKVEELEMGDYVSAFVRNIESMVGSDAADWAKIIGCRIINAGGDTELVQALQQRGPKAIAAFRKVIEPVAAKQTKVAEKVRNLLGRL